MVAQPALPYPGLRAFTRDENVLFFGREGCVDDMLTTLDEARFLAVLGASGSGKSSLVRTGLLHALERGGLKAAGANWRIADFHPGQDPMRALAAALVDTPEEAKIDALESYLSVWPGALAEWAKLGNLAPGQSLLLLVDQFEELFRFGNYAEREAVEAFVALILESASAQDVPIYVALTMRSEYLGACALLPDLTDRINQGLYLTPRMDREACRQAITGPANVFNFEIEPRLVNQLLNDMENFAPFEAAESAAGGVSGPRANLLSRRADQLPLMQHALNRLWMRAEKSAEGRCTLRFEDYLAIGGLEGALQSHGEEVLSALPEDCRDDAETVFRCLISGPDPERAVRRAVPLAQLQEEAGPHTLAIVEAFRQPDCNFLRPEARFPLEDATLVDISHESLIRQWGRLREWTRREAEADENWDRLIDAQRRWESGAGDLLSGLSLASYAQWWSEAEPSKPWASRHGGRFEEVSDFLERSENAQAAAQAEERERAERERLRWRRVSIVFGLMAVMAVGALAGLGALGVNYQSLQAQRAEAAEEARKANLVADRSREIAERIDAENKVRVEEFMAQQSQLSEELQNAEAEAEGIIKDAKTALNEADALVRTLMTEQEELEKNQERLKNQVINERKKLRGLRKAELYCEKLEVGVDETCDLLLGRGGDAQ